MKQTYVPFTSTLPVHLLRYLDDYSKVMNLPKNRILERALQLFIEEQKKKEMINSFKKAADDKEMLKLAEEGFGDYLEMLDR